MRVGRQAGWLAIAATAGFGGTAWAQEESPQVQEEVDQTEADVAEADAEAADEEFEIPPPKDFWTGWTTNVELGLNGSTGNTERFNVRAGLETERLTDRMESRASLTYTLGTEEGSTTEEKFRAAVRNDWLVPASRWRYFAKASADYDDMQDYDWLLAASAGVGYEFIDTDDLLLIGRVGAGLSKKIGGDDNRLRPEGLIGGDFEYQITERSKVFATADWYPDLGDWPQYRATASGGYEVMVDPELNLSLRLGAEMKYDSSPGEGFHRADVDYFAVLVWTF